MHLAKSCMPDLYSDSALRVQWMSTHTANYLHIQDELQINDSWPQQKVCSSSSQLIHKYFIVDLKPCFKATQQFRDGEKLLEKGSRGEEYPNIHHNFILPCTASCALFGNLIRGIQLLVQYLKL